MPIDLGTFISPALAFLGAAGAFYVKSSADSAAAMKVAKAFDVLMAKIDVINEAVADAAIAIRVAEERQGSIAGDVTSVEKQIDSLVTYIHDVQHKWSDAHTALLVRLVRSDDAGEYIAAPTTPRAPLRRFRK